MSLLATPRLAFILMLLLFPHAGHTLENEDLFGPEVTDFKLDNGLQVVVIPDHRAPVVTHMLWYKVGSADEERGKSGIAHFFEHLMFKGTKNHAPGEFSRKVAEIGGQENAFTSYDYTAYFQQVAPEALPTMMAYEADRMRNLVLNEEVVATEREVVIEERSSRVENEPHSLLSEEVNATLYQNHPYGVPVIGWMHEIRKLDLADAEAFYDRYYVPNNAVLIVAGDVEAGQVRELAEKTYGKIPAGTDLPQRLRPSEPTQNTKRTVSLSDPRVTRANFRKFWLVPSYETAEPGEAEALDLLSEILGGGTRSRLYKSLVVDRRIATSVGAWYQGGALDQSEFGVYGAPLGDTGVEELEQAVLDEIVKIAEDGVTRDELTKAKNRFLKSAIFAHDSQSGLARIYGSSLAVGASIEDIRTWPERIKQVDVDQVQRAARRYLSDNRSVTGYLLPEIKDPS